MPGEPSFLSSLLSVASPTWNKNSRRFFDVSLLQSCQRPRGICHLFYLHTVSSAGKLTFNLPNAFLSVSLEANKCCVTGLHSELQAHYKTPASFERPSRKLLMRPLNSINHVTYSFEFVSWLRKLCQKAAAQNWGREGRNGEEGTTTWALGISKVYHELNRKTSCGARSS